MQIPVKLTATTSEGRNPPQQRQPIIALNTAREESETGTLVPGTYDPASRVHLSAETLLFLSRAKREKEKYPPLTREEWNNTLTPQLAAREHGAFGKYSETGDMRGYYRAFIEYYDDLRPDDQHSLRYFGTREAAVAGLRSMDYEDETGGERGEYQTLVSVLLDAEKDALTVLGTQEMTPLVKGDMFGWESPAVSYEAPDQPRAALSEIEKFYSETF